MTELPANLPSKPTPEPGKPEPFTKLSRQEKKLWDRVTTNLDRMGVLAKCDGNQLRRYVTYLDTWTKIKDAIEGMEKRAKGNILGVLSNEETAKVYKRMKCELHRAEDALRKSEREFGLTPSARTGLISVTTNITINNTVVPNDAKIVYDLGATD